MNKVLIFFVGGGVLNSEVLPFAGFHYKKKL